MKLLIFTFCAILVLSVSIPLENKSKEVLNPLHFYKKNGSSEAIEHHESKLSNVENRDYIFLNSFDGKVIIIDATTHEEVISYILPEISRSIAAIVNDTFYNIDTLNGTIFSTKVGNLLEGPDSIKWTLAGAYPKEELYIRGSSAVNGSLIYFFTRLGSLYYYNTTSRVTFKVGYIPSGDPYASLVVAGNILYIHRNRDFYSVNGTSITSIPTPNDRFYAGLFQQGNDICLIGAWHEYVDDPDLVYCYNPVSKQWSNPSRINYARSEPGVVTIGSQTYIFCGQNEYNSSDFYLKSVEVLNHETNLWGFIPPISEGLAEVQALAFNF